MLSLRASINFNSLRSLGVIFGYLLSGFLSRLMIRSFSGRKIDRRAERPVAEEYGHVVPDRNRQVRPIVAVEVAGGEGRWFPISGFVRLVSL